MMCICKKWTIRNTDVQTDRKTEGQTYRKTDRQTEIQWKSKQTNRCIIVKLKRFSFKVSFKQISWTWRFCGSGHVSQSCPYAEYYSQRVSNQICLFVCLFVCLFGVLRPTRAFCTHLETSSSHTIRNKCNCINRSCSIIIL